MNNFIIGCVGKPSSGKSSFLNSVTEANAKVGNYPFTTIEPNIGVTFYQAECPCLKYNKMDYCLPRYGKCVKGTRYIPVKVLDVAGLVPGASEGKGLGNKFLDDLRHAHVLLHILDISGRTNEKGEETIGYDPINDIEWLESEIENWIFNNLWKRWPSIIRRHISTKSTALQSLRLQFSGYGANLTIIQKTLDSLGIKEPCEMEKWNEEKVKKLVKQFIKERFPTILVLNKIDLAESDNNITKIFQKYEKENIVLTSALAECFLKKMRKEGYINYIDGSDFFETIDDINCSSLKPLDNKIRNRLEKIKDLVLFRYGSTGVHEAIKRAIEYRNLIPVYPVKNIHNFTDGISKEVFRDCMLIYPGTTVREFCGMLSSEMEKHFLYAEGVSGKRLGEDEIITKENNIIKFITTAISEVTYKEPKKQQQNTKIKNSVIKNHDV